MDDVSVSRNVSCRQIAWLLGLCREQNIDPQRVLRGIPCSVEQLEDESQFIDWHSFSGFIANIRKYLSEEELLEGGIQSWQSAHLKHLSHAGRLLFSVRDQYLAYFGPAGELAHSFPIQFTLAPVGPLAMDVRLSMRGGCNRSRAFEIIIAGQLIGLPRSMGHGPASVEIEDHARSVIYHVRYDHMGGMLAPLRRAFTWLFAARATASELNEAEDSLLQKYHELQQVSDSLEQANRTIAASETRLNQFFELSTDAVWIANDADSIVYANPVLMRLVGSNPTGQSLASLVTPEDFQKIRQADTKAPPAAIEVTLQGHGQQVHRLLVHIAPCSDETNTRMCIGRDITLEERAQQDARVQSKRLLTITSHARDGIVTIDERNRIVFANPASIRIFGYELSEMIGMDIGLLLPESLGEPRLHELYRPHESPMESDLHVRGLRKDRTLIPLELTFTSRTESDNGSRTCFIRDASVHSRHAQELTALEQQLQASQKMEAIGQLTGGIAHDFNNLLVAITGYSDLALDLDVARDNAELTLHLQEIRHAARRAGDMTSRLLAFSRRRTNDPTLIDVGDVLDGLDLLLKRLLPENISVSVFRDCLGPLPVMADRGQLEQVLVNLAVNARDAMPQGGELRIDVDSKPVPAGEDDDGRPCLIIRVSDNGAGMTPEVQARIFEPFFTTKPEGSGTGLGLPVVANIMREHGGQIEVASEPGEGTRFSITLPLQETRTLPAVDPTANPTSGGAETILVVEDNDQVRHLARLILQGAGYQVMEAADGPEALDVFEAHHTGIDLVLVDIVLPHLGGRAVSQKMQHLAPALKVLFTSGYTDADVHLRFIEDTGHEFIAKPYSTDALRARVRAVLDQKQSSSAPTTIVAG
ncbi:MAG: ATP-binding protein [Proteobacteria bacterium]|jgi:PAS domain S-box-containing protein|nr:ATP-binding protein [Pseudomonadota bacterium]